ncbi:MAG: ABC transporter substrate-binding protein [Candidatus Humimicrobiaceae bacterium]
MKKKCCKTAILILVYLSAVCFLAAGCSSFKDTNDLKNSNVILDASGRYVYVPKEINRIISLNSGMSTLISVFGDSDKIVGRDNFSTFPSYLNKIASVGKNSSDSNFELILETEPDLVIADTMLSDSDRAKIESTGIPVIVDSTSDPDRIFYIIRNLGIILGKKQKAEEIIKYMEVYLDLADQRITEKEEKGGNFPLIYFEARNDYKSASAENSANKPIVAAGGINIAAAEPISSPRINSEYILKKNPDIIIRRVSGDAGLEEMKLLREDLMSRAGLKEVKAVKEGKVYIIKADVFLTLRYPVGLLYYAKWFHPDIFSDINPDVLHKKFIVDFFGTEEWEKINEIFVYPSN